MAALLAALAALAAPAAAQILTVEQTPWAPQPVLNRWLKTVTITFVPPLPEQAAIARFLDQFNHKIDRYIRAKEKLIALLEEQKQAIVHQAVTGRLDVRTGRPYAAYKPSGVEWLGDVPEHWEVQKLKHWLLVNQSTLSDNTDPDYAFNHVDIGSVGTGRLSTRPERLRFQGSPSRARRIVRSGDTIISTVRTYLKAILHAEEAKPDLIVSTGFAVLTPTVRYLS